MKTKVLIFFCIIIFSCNILAYTKQDIIDYAATQDVCDAKTSAIFNTYRNTFTRLVRQKKLTEEQCNQIMNYLINSVGILNKKGVCKLSDLDKLTSSERNTIYSNLSTGANMIINAPTEGFEESNSTPSNNNNNSSTNVNTATGGNVTNTIEKPQGTSGINVNKVDNTIDIYEDGILIDKIQINQEKLTYTGPSMVNIYVVILSIIFIISFVIYYVLYPKHTRQLRFIKNILMSTGTMSLVILSGILIVKPKIQTIGSVVEMFNLKTVDEQKEIVVTKEKEIIYPSYGYIYGKLSNKNLNINVDVAFGDSSDILNNSIGTASWSSLPTEGKNIVMSGHNSHSMLANLENVKLGEELVLDTNYATCVYKVYDTKIVKDTDVESVKISLEDETLVLYTCYPFSQYIYSDERFVVYSKLQSVEWK